jgi:Tfp pilus assembly PilM family ATPase/Tfp pilus assembly protein PilN
MARLLALEWDSNEVRVAVGTPRGGDALIEDAFLIALPRSEGTDADEKTAGLIASALAERRIGRVVGLAAVGRAGIELKELTLPPAPDDELPDLVRFQALREFHSLGEDWPLDFIPMAGPEGSPRKVLAAAVSPDLVEQIRQTCLKAKITPERLVLRPCAAASLLTRARWEAVARVKLLVDLLAEEADLTVLVDNEVVFLRTVRLPVDVLSGGGQATLLGEIRRTVAAARNQMSGLTIEAIYLCGSGAEHSALAAHIETGAGIATHLFDPFAGLTLAASLQRSMPSSPGRFAPVLGMLLDEAQHCRHTVDFLNPRRRPPPPSRSRKLVWGATAACVVLAAGFHLIHRSLGELDDKIVQLSTESKDLDKVVAKSKDLDRAAKEIGAWCDADVNWLDELRELSLEMPSARNVLLTRLNMGTATAAAQIDLEGLLRSVDTARNLEKDLSDGFHSVQGRNLQQDASREGYTWKFTSTIVVKPESTESYREHAKAAEAKRATAEPDTPSDRRLGRGGFGGPRGGFDPQAWEEMRNRFGRERQPEPSSTAPQDGASAKEKPAADADAAKEAPNGT